MVQLMRLGFIAVFALSVSTAQAQGVKNGQAPPEIKISEARGLPANWKLADAKGKWIIIEFWGHW